MWAGNFQGESLVADYVSDISIQQLALTKYVHPVLFVSDQRRINSTILVTNKNQDVIQVYMLFLAVPWKASL